MLDIIQGPIPLTAFTPEPIPDAARQMHDKLLADWEEFAGSEEAGDPTRRVVVRCDFLRALANIELGLEMRYGQK